MHITEFLIIVPANLSTLKAGHSARPWWSDATARAGCSYVTTTTIQSIIVLEWIAPVNYIVTSQQ